MITKPSQLHTINSRHISSCIPSSKREENHDSKTTCFFSKSEAGEAPSTLSSLRAQDFTFCSLWPAFSKFAQVTLTGFTVKSKCRQSAWPSNRLVFFWDNRGRIYKNAIFQGIPVSWVESILTHLFFRSQKPNHWTIPLGGTGNSHQILPAFLGSQPQLHSAKVGVSAAWPPSSGVVWYYYRNGFDEFKQYQALKVKDLMICCWFWLAFRHPWLSWQQKSMEKQWETLGKNSAVLASTCNKPKHNDHKSGEFVESHSLVR